MAREKVEFDVIGRDQGGSKTFRDVGNAAAKAADQVDDLGKTADTAADQVKGLGDSTKGAGDDADQAAPQWRGLADEIAATQERMRALADEINRTGNLDLTKDLRRQQTELRKLLRVQDLLPEPDVSGWLARVAQQVRAVPAAGAVGATLGAAIAPTLAAGIAGAVAGGVGAGGVIGGIVLAARDEQVKAAGSSLGQFIIGDLEQRAAGFVPATLDAIDDIREGWRSLGPDLDRIFESDRFVDPLVAGGLAGARKLVAGIADVMDNADPAVDALAAGFERIGDAAGDTLSLLAEDADEGASAIDDLTVSVANLIRVTGGLIHAAAELKGFFDGIDQGIDRGRFALEDWMSSGGALENFGLQLDLTADGFAAGSKEAQAYRDAVLGTADAADFATLKTAGMTDAEIAAADASGRFRMATQDAARGPRETAAAAEEATAQIRTLYEALSESVNRAFDSEQSSIRMRQAFLELRDAAEDGAGAGIDSTTDAAVRNHQALINAGKAAMENAASIRQTTGDHQRAAEVTEKARADFLKAAAAMKVEKADAEALATSLFGIPNIKRNVTADTGPARRAVQSYDQWLASVNLDKTSTLYQRVITEQSTARGGYREFSVGGYVDGPGPRGVDSVRALLAPGEGVLTVREVDALGGPAGFAQLRASLRRERPGGGTGPGGAVLARAATGGGSLTADDLYRAVARALQTLPIVRVDAGRTADIYSRTG